MLYSNTKHKVKRRKLDPAIREQLIIDHLPLVHKIAHRIHKTIPKYALSLSDLVSSGTIGLIQAVDCFDESKNIKLCSYAKSRIRGHILDDIRELDIVKRDTRKFFSDRTKTIETLSQEFKRYPAHDEVAKALNMPLDEYYNKIQVRLKTYSIDTPVFSTSHVSGMQVKDGNIKPYVEDLIEDEALTLVRKAILQLKPRYQQIVFAYYYENTPMHEIAFACNVNESRISQILSTARKIMKKELEAHYDKKTFSAVA